MRNRKLRHIRPSRAFWPKVTVAHTQENSEGVVTSGSHVTTTKKKAREKAGHAQNLLLVRNTSGQKAPLGRIWRHFRLRMRRTYFRTWSLPVMRNGPIHRKCRRSLDSLRGSPWVYATGSCATSVVTEGHLIPWKSPWGVLYDDFLSCAMVRSTANANLSVPIYYLGGSIVLLFLEKMSICKNLVVCISL
jgi:hypothetical protein